MLINYALNMQHCINLTFTLYHAFDALELFVRDSFQRHFPGGGNMQQTYYNQPADILHVSHKMRKLVLTDAQLG